MVGFKLLRPLSVITLAFFIFFIGTAELSPGTGQQDEDILLKARRLYQDGEYESSIKLLRDFIEKLKAMAEQKKNVAEAFYLLAKIYFEVGDDVKADDNLRKVYSTYPNFTKQETNFQFRDRSERIRAEYLIRKETELKGEKKSQVIEKPARKKKKKKMPIIILVGAIGLAAILILALSGGKKSEEEPIDEVFDIRGNWSISSRFTGQEPRTEPLHCQGGSPSNGSAFLGTWEGTYNVTDKLVRLRFEDDGFALIYSGMYTNVNHMRGNMTSNGSEIGSWEASRVQNN
jgi:hypothetical protein